MRTAGVALVLLVAFAANAAPQKRTPAGVVFVIDRSSSMQGAKLDSVKQAINGALDSFDRADRISLVVADQHGEIVFKDLLAAQRGLIRELVNKLAAGGGTDLRPALKIAASLLKTTPVDKKHVLVLTDGESASEGLDKIAKDMRNDGITVSAVGIPGSDRNLLTLIATAGGGRVYKIDDLKAIASVFAAELRKALQVGATVSAPKHEPVSVAFVIDRSGSMQGPKLDAAKEAVLTAMAALGTGDRASLVIVNSEAEVVFAELPSSQSDRAKALVEPIESRGSRSVAPGLTEAFKILGKSKRHKHVVLVSDGAPNMDNLDALLAEMANADITVSTIGMKGADKNMLATIADHGGGRTYIVEDPAALSPIFINELQEAGKR
jgi:Mg-chelatase subunit ChlD